MEEVTTWNGKPRFMWVWDEDENERKKEYVMCILSTNEMEECGTSFPVRVFHYGYKHCAEIEETPKKETRLTNYELSQLLKCFGVEGKFKDCSEWHGEYGYNDGTEENECQSDIIIRYRQCEWMPATRETVLKWCRESSGSDIARFVEFIGWNKQ